MTRCSQVTWFRSWLLNTQTTQVRFDHSRQYLATVMSSAMLFICMAPSPTSATTGRSGWANLAAIAYGTAAPIEASPPDSEHICPRFTRYSLAYQFAQEPLSLVTIASSGSCGDLSQTPRCGLTGWTLVNTRASSVFHQSLIPLSIRRRQLRS